MPQGAPRVHGSPSPTSVAASQVVPRCPSGTQRGSSPSHPPDVPSRVQDRRPTSPPGGPSPPSTSASRKGPGPTSRQGVASPHAATRAASPRAVAHRRHRNGTLGPDRSPVGCRRGERCCGAHNRAGCRTPRIGYIGAGQVQRPTLSFGTCSQVLPEGHEAPGPGWQISAQELFPEGSLSAQTAFP